ncbi:MAG: helix-turn-helix domain-containing protein [Lentimicrobiaceae bacterium]|nr:helix-turn-helix domain-containing protein [Lentimicrobiaceae bacterium]
MKDELGKLPIGKRIEEVFKQRNMSISEFAKCLDCKPQNLYNLFRRKTMDIALLCKISKVLEHNFIGEICAQKNYPLSTHFQKTTIIFGINNDVDSKNLKKLLKTIKQLDIRTIEIKED